MLGNLTTAALPQDHIVITASIFMGISAVGVIALITYFKRWKWLWTEWLTSVDHKKIGIMYIILAFVMIVRGFADAVMMRLQQILSVGDSYGYLPPEHYDQIFTAHGVTMIFFVAMPLLVGLVNVVLPLQIGARDVAYPFLNSLSLWLTVAGAALVNVSLVIGEFAATGWLSYPPLSGITFSPGVGVDYYIWALQLSGAASLLAGINFFATIIMMRCPGMTLMRMPVFVWTVLGSMALVIITFPIFTASLAMLSLDRMMGMHFFTADFGGNAMMYVNLIWAWGHPEVYILVLPAFGIFSEVVSTFARKRLFGYTTMIWAVMAITFLSFVVWVHHFFTMGAGANVNAFFGIMTMIIAIPTGVKVFNWLFTMFRGRITFASPMLWLVGFIFTFTIGGMTGVLLSVPAADFQLHNSLFLIAHFHNTIIGGVVFGYFAGITYWFPKAFGFKLNEKLGKAAFWAWIIGFFVTFIPLYILGLMGMTRRLSHIDAASDWQPLLIVAGVGVLIIAVGVVLQILQFIVSVRDRKHNMDTTGDAWGEGRTLEWSTSSPPPFYNFATIPTVHGRHAFWDMKHGESSEPKSGHYEDIHMPKSTGIGFYIGGVSFVMCFALVWHIWWLAALGLAAIITLAMIRSFDYETEYFVPKEEVAKIEAARA
ncbi:MAG: cytochrome o ubiquinol oxidase subunit I [Candidatus Pacebacteria bacterium]|jgi:cytochrome o ubiquinol oxidase subunit 1|nr:cytochrome o ubiquinol oxidase subunit I [Candidatus Paceibacterota bacterium]